MDKNWEKVAKENYKDLKTVNPEKATKDQYLLYAASVALLDHFNLKGTSIPSEDENPAQDENQVIAEHIRDELFDSEMYYSLWTHTKDAELKTIALDELRHAEYWLRMAKEKQIQGSELQDLITWHGALLAKM